MLIARKLFEDAITLDANYAFAYSGLAWSHSADVWLGATKNPKESLGLAIELGEKALALDPSSAGAHRKSRLFLCNGKTIRQGCCFGRESFGLRSKFF